MAVTGRRRAPGLTVFELMIACLVFVMLGVATTTIYRAGLKASEKVDASSDAYRQGMLLLEQLKLELRGARLLTPLPGSGETSEIVYLYPSVANGILLVDPGGEPVWAGTATLRFARPRLLRLDSANPGLERTLFRSQGDVRFERLDVRMLRVKVDSQTKDAGGSVARSARYRYQAEFYLGNQP